MRFELQGAGCRTAIFLGILYAAVLVLGLLFVLHIVNLTARVEALERASLRSDHAITATQQSRLSLMATVTAHTPVGR